MTEIQPDVEGLAPGAERASYQELFEFAPVSYLVSDNDGMIVEANRNAGELLGLSPERLVGKPIAIFVPMEHRKQFRRTLLGLPQSTSEAEWQLDLQLRDGERITVQLNASPARGGGLRWMIQDVSERVAGEQRLRMLAAALEERVLERTDELEQERGRLAAIVEQMPGGLLIASAPDGKVIVVNEEARRILGIDDGAPLHGIRGEVFRLDGSRYELDEFPLARALLGETVRTERLQLAREGGERFFLDVSAAPVRDRAERITAAVSLLEDVTVEESRDRAEREFVTNAAHELQSPLAAITSAVEVLQAGAKEKAERDLFIGHIEREAQRLDRLTRALLTLARAQVDVEEPRLELIDLCPLLEQIAERMEPAEGVELAIACPKELALVSNMALLEQAISNVVSNSVKYTSEGSIRLLGARSGGEVVVTVEDTGQGIPDEALSHVSERFYRAGNTGEGFGLGLAIVDAAMKALDGELTIASRKGYGTTVTLKLPVGATRVGP